MAPSKFNQGLAIFSVVGLVVVFALAYNMGSSNENSRSVKMGVLTRKRMDVSKERLNMCLDNKRDMKNGRFTKETLLQHLRDSNEKLSQENVLFRDQNQEGRAALKECNTALSLEREEHTGTKEANATHMLEHLQEHHEWLEKSIKQANETREMKRDEIKQLIWSYKLENMQLEAQLRTLHVERAKKAAEARAAEIKQKQAAAQAAAEAAEQRAKEQAEKTAGAAKTKRLAELEEEQAAAAATAAKKAKEIASLRRKASAGDAAVVAAEPAEKPAEKEAQPQEAPAEEKLVKATTPPRKPTVDMVALRAKMLLANKKIKGTTCPAYGRRYGVMLDAGSTGSRVHVFSFDVQPNGTSLIGELFEALKPGLSSFAHDPVAASSSLLPLLKAAVKAVPRAAARCTPIALKATAGLRLLGPEKSSAILEAVTATIKQATRFAVPPEAAIVMDAKDEGPYAWLTTNFLLQTLAPNTKTAAVLDMGGGSTQVVFVPDSADALQGAPASSVYQTKFNGASFKAFQHSYLGLGLKEAGKSIVKAAAAEGAAPFACFPADYTEAAESATVKTESGKQSFADCQAFIAATLFKKVEDDACPQKPCAIGNVFQPSLTTAFSGPIYAFSYFYDRIEANLPESGEVTVGDYKKIGTQVCADNGDATKNKGTMCMDLAFLHAILADGYGLADTQALVIKKKINGKETAWPLGAAISEMKF